MFLPGIQERVRVAVVPEIALHEREGREEEQVR
jgi:hypothetical protein